MWRLNPGCKKKTSHLGHKMFNRTGEEHFPERGCRQRNSLNNYEDMKITDVELRDTSCSACPLTHISQLLHSTDYSSVSTLTPLLIFWKFKQNLVFSPNVSNYLRQEGNFFITQIKSSSYFKVKSLQIELFLFVR